MELKYCTMIGTASSLFDNELDNVLIVDDDKDFCDALADILESKGYPFLTATNALQAQEITQNQQVQVIFVDVRLGSTNGLDLIKSFKRSNSNSICVVMTAYTDFSTAVDALREGAYDYLQKPFHPNEFDAVLQRCMNIVKLEREKKRAQEDLRIANLVLETRIEERTSELHEINQLLKKEIAQKNETEQELKAALKEKDILLKEIHHRVKNNLQIITSLLSLQSDTLDDSYVKNKFEQCETRIHAMSMIHENLYNSRSLASIDLGKYVEAVAENLFSIFGIRRDEIDLNIDINDVSLDFNTAIPCGLLINELITNSLKYAFRSGHKSVGDNKSAKIIRVVARIEDDNEYVLSVCDNGVGIPDDIDFLKTSTLGLQLVNALTQQLHGSISLDRSNGTEFIIKFRTDNDN